MKKRYVILVLVLVAVIVAGTVCYMIFKDKSQNDLLTSEINALSADNINVDIKTSGDYAVVEKMIKEDYKLYIESVNKLRENYDELSNLKLINIENFQNDGPEFTTSLETLNGIKDENAEIMSALNDLVDENKIEEKVTANGLDSRFGKMYKDILSQIKLKEGVDQLAQTDTKFDNYAASLISVLTYMKDNANEWFIEKGTLKSKSQTFIDEYNKMVNETNIEL